MRSYFSTLFFGLLLSLLSLPQHFFVDARINTPVDTNAIKTERRNTNYGQAQAEAERSLSEIANAFRLLFQNGSSHRSLGGGVNHSASWNKFQRNRNLVQQQSWARNDEGEILWWIWLIIGLSCGLCVIVCCCSSACCLRD